MRVVALPVWRLVVHKPPHSTLVPACHEAEIWRPRMSGTAAITMPEDNDPWSGLRMRVGNTMEADDGGEQKSGQALSIS